MNDNDKVIAKLKRRIAGLERTLQIVSGHSTRNEFNQKQLLKVVSDNIPVPMIITSEEGEVLFFNTKALEIFGYQVNELHNMKAVDLYEDAAVRRKFLGKVAEEGEARDFAVNLKKADGTVFPASFFSQGLVFEGRNCLLTVIHDLSEIRKEEQKRLAIEKQIRQTQKMEALGTMAGGIAHDFNNVLTVVFGKAELAMMLLPKDSKASAHIADVLTAANRAKEMIRQIMSFSRKAEEEHKPFPIKFIVAEAVKMIEAMTPSNIKLTLAIEPKSSVIVGNPAQIHQILMNLCANANYAMKDRGGTIEISLQEVSLGVQDVQVIPRLGPGSYVRLTVRDNGPGIEKAVMDRIFEPFFTTKPTGEGTGMGLAVVHGIVQRHGGSVIVESRPGEGTAFHCFFPLVTRAEETVPDVPGNEKERGGNEKVMLVDDDIMILETFGQVLTDLGYLVTTEAESARALQIFKKDRNFFDLVVTDEKMPGMSGRELTKEIRKARADIPVIIITGSEIEEKCFLQLGADAVIFKPFTSREFAARLRAVLDKGRPAARA